LSTLDGGWGVWLAVSIAATQQCISFSSFYFGFFTFSAVNIFEDSAAVIVVHCSVTEGVFRSPSSHSVKGS